MKAFYLLARLRTVELVRNRSSLGIFIGLPLILLLAVGGIFAAGHPFERRQVALVTSSQTGSAVRQALAAYPEVHLLEQVDAQIAVAQLRSHILDAVLMNDPQSPDQLRLIVSDRGRLLSQALAAALAPSLPKITVETVASPRFGYVHHLFSGLVAFNILVTGLLGMGAAMTRYRQIQLLKKLALTPLWRGTFVAAQLASRSFLGLLQVIALIIVAKLLFSLPLSWTSSLWLVLVAALGLFTFMGIGFLLAAAIRSEGVLVEGVSAVMTPLVLMSEMFFPLTELPRPLQLIGELLPSTHLVRLLRLGVISDSIFVGATWLPSLLLLSAWLLISYVAAVVLFRWHD